VLNSVTAKNRSKATEVKAEMLDRPEFFDGWTSDITSAMVRPGIAIHYARRHSAFLAEFLNSPA
jgi:hypothetical protein